MDNLWLAQAACFFCTALLLVSFLRRSSTVQKALDHLISISSLARPREPEAESQLAGCQAALRKAEERCSELETANLSLRSIADGHLQHMASMERMKEAFARVRELEHAQMEIAGELIELRQQREDVVRQLEVALSEDRQDGLLAAGLKELDAQITRCLEQCRMQATSARREYMELMCHHTDMIGLDHPLDDLIWIKLQAEKAYSLALKLIEQIQVQMSEVELRKRCYDSTMERLKHHAKRVRHSNHPGKLPELQDALAVRPERQTMPSPSHVMPQDAHAPSPSKDSSRVSVLDAESLRTALREPRLPNDLMPSSIENVCEDSSMPSESLRDLLISLERVSSLPPAAPILIENERELAVFCRFLMRRVKLGESLRLQLMGDHGPDYSEVTVGKLSWVAPHYQN